MLRYIILGAVCIQFLLGSSLHAGGPKVHVVVGPDAPRLEKFAAKELAAQFQQLFEAQVEIVDKMPRAADHLILLGSPATNPAVKIFGGTTWPKLTDQGHLVRSVDEDGAKALLVGGGSPTATLWAVYELGHRFGMRYLLHGDVPPAEQAKLKLTGFNVVMEPTLRLRTWRTIDSFAIGPESWGLADQKALLGQLAKLKFNRVMLAVHPWQPFVDYEFKGVKKQAALLWHGHHYPVAGDTAGRGAFKGAKVFNNPDFQGKTAYADRNQAGVTLARGIIDAAHDLGMTAGLAMSPLEFPKEFAAVLPKARVFQEKLTVGPGPLQTPDDPLLKDLAATQIRAYLDTYPTIDALYLSLPELPDWVEHHEKAWQKLDERTGVGKAADLKQLLESARKRSLVLSGDRGVKALQGNITALQFFHNLAADPDLFQHKDGRKVEVTLAEVDPALFPVLDKVIPAGSSALHFVDSTARRVAVNKEMLGHVSPKTSNNLILTLADDNAGVLPQLAMRSLHPLVGALPKHGWQGFSTRYRIAGDLNPSLHYLARASFDPKTTPDAAYDDLITAMCGPGVSERLIKGFDLIEKATDTIDQNDQGFAFPTPDVVMKHYSAKEVPPWWKTVRDHYAGAMDEMYRGIQRSRDGARPFILYHAKRLEFAYEYMNCVEALRLAGQAKAKGDSKTQLEKLEAATEAMFNGLSAYSEVARDNSDRGVIAVLNEYGYRPLRKELESAKKAAAK